MRLQYLLNVEGVNKKGKETTMTTKVYGCSDDLIEFEGDVNGEAGRFGTGDDGHGALLICSDGTMLEIKYGKADMGVWGITLLDAGSLFVHINPCMDEDADPHSDIAHFKDGLKWAYVASDWEKIK